MGRRLRGVKQVSRRAQEREVRKRIILEAAARVFADYGYHQATMAEIARAAEISLGGLYAIFPGKAHLYGDLVRLKQNELMTVLRRKVELVGHVRGRVTAAQRKALTYQVAESIIHYFETNEAFFRIYVNESGSLGWNIRASLGDQAFELYEEVVQVTASIVMASEKSRSARVEARVKALVIVGAVNAIITEWVSHKRKRPLVDYLPPLRIIIGRIVG